MYEKSKIVLTDLLMHNRERILKLVNNKLFISMRRCCAPNLPPCYYPDLEKAEY